MKTKFSVGLVCLVLFVGCREIIVCNGTSDPVVFRVLGVSDDTVMVDPCECESIVVVDPLDNEVDVVVSDVNGGVLGELGDVSWVATFDGFEVTRSNDGAPDLTDKRTIRLCNESQEAVRIYPSHISAPTDAWLIAPGACRDYSSVHIGEVSFTESSSNSDCRFELIDGVNVVWDGVALTCHDGGGGGPIAPINVSNDAPLIDDAVFIVAEGEPLNGGTLYNPGQSRTVDYAAGAPIKFQAWALDQTLLVECVLDDPSLGDLVIWNGTDLFCLDN